MPKCIQTGGRRGLATGAHNIGTMVNPPLPAGCLPSRLDALISLHWLRARERVRFKTAVLMYKATQHSWNCAVIPESTGSCRRSAWSTFPPLCSDQSSAGAAREADYRRRPGLPGRRTHHLEQPTGQRDISPVSLSTFRQRLKTFLFQASFPDIITDPR